MNAFLSLGRWVFPFPFAILGLLYFMNAETMAESAIPAYLPVKIFWVYLWVAGLFGAAIAMYVGKYDKLAATLLSVMLLLSVLLVHLPAAMAGGQYASISMNMLWKNLALMGGAMMYAQHLARDNSIVG